MLPTICQACGGGITHDVAWPLKNPNICASCAEAWDEPEPAAERELMLHALGPPDALQDGDLQEVV